MNASIGHSGRRPSRRGSALIVFMVLLTLLAIVSTSLIRRGGNARRRAITEERRVQADWLARSGLDRARSSLQADPGYDGETWELSADDLGGRDPAIVRIVVQAPEDEPRLRVVRVQADYPREEPLRVRRTMTLTLDIGRTAAGEEP